MASKHIEFEDYIQNVYKFKKNWENQCNKYDIKNQPSVLPPVRRIIVIGDIHGDWDMTQKLLKVGSLIDNTGNWIGGDTVVVQVGDQIDRCRYKFGNGNPSCDKPEATNPDEGNDWKILQYFTQLHQQAKEYGGAVYSLMGNHELMNVQGDFRYVSYEGRREFINYKKPDETIIENGDEARQWAFKPGNPISNFLACTRQMALIIGSNLFVHAGLLPIIAKKYSINSLNQLMSLYLWDKLDKPSEYADVFFTSDISPLWNRVFGNIGMQSLNNSTQYLDLNKAKDKCSSLLNPLKEIYQVDKIYIGHTPLMDHGISSVCNGKVWLTDFGASKAFDKFDRTSTQSTENELHQRSTTRRAQVLEILEDGNQINILS
jgi:hypothetical protein